MLLPVKSYTALVTLISYAHVRGLPTLAERDIATATDVLGYDEYADGSPVTERCPVSPLAATERAVYVTEAA